MGLTDKKLEIAIFATAAVFVAGLGYLFKAPVQNVLATADVIYEMPRPKSFLAALFDLGGRDVSRKYINPFEKKKAEEAKKAADAKKATEAAKVAAVAAKKADGKKNDPTKKPSVNVKVVQADPAKRLFDKDIGYGGSGGVTVQMANNTNNKADNSANPKDKKVTAEQWRSLVLGQPTQANVNKMVAAYMAGDMTDSEFYGIAKELMHNSNSETQALGLSAVSSFYTTSAFATVATSYSVFPTEVQTKADAYLLGYANTGRLGILASALKSSSTDVVSMATQIVLKGYQAAKSNVGSGTSGSTPGSDVSVNAVSSYTRFVSIFQTLAQSSDSEIASLAISALNQIQTGVASL
ncbi:MAG: hypothetical protein ACM3MG_13500 [Bacillota bacterium]